MRRTRGSRNAEGASPAVSPHAVSPSKRGQVRRASKWRPWEFETQDSNTKNREAILRVRVPRGAQATSYLVDGNLSFCLFTACSVRALPSIAFDVSIYPPRAAHRFNGMSCCTIPKSSLWSVWPQPRPSSSAHPLVQLHSLCWICGFRSTDATSTRTEKGRYAQNSGHSQPPARTCQRQ